MSFFEFSKMPYQFKRKGVRIKTVTGKNAQMISAQLDADFESCHSHPQEQMGMVLDGEIELTINGETKICKTGDAYHIPADAVHSFKVLSGRPVEILDIFSPVKDENII